MVQLMEQADNKEKAELEKTYVSFNEMLIEVLPGMHGGYNKQGERSELSYWIGYRDLGKSRLGGGMYLLPVVRVLLQQLRP